MRFFDKKIKTAWVSGFVSYEWHLIEELGKKGFDIHVMENVGKAVQELEGDKYKLIVVSSELGVNGDVDNDFKLHLYGCKNDNANLDYNCSKISLYFIDRIKKGRKSEVNLYTPLVVIDYFSKFVKDSEKEMFILAGAKSMITGKMGLDEIVIKMKYF